MIVDATVDGRAEVMDLTTPQFIETTPTGLRLSRDLSFDEWRAIAKSFGKALQTAAWCIGDWLVYGERKWGKQVLMDGEEFDPSKPNRIPSHAFDDAVTATGLDRATLQTYASVCRKIPHEERRIHVSFGHHRILAPLPPAKRLEWWSILDSESRKIPTVKRLALSVRVHQDAPAIVTDKEIERRGTATGHDNHIPHLTRLLTILRRTVPKMTESQRAALRADAAELMGILDGL